MKLSRKLLLLLTILIGATLVARGQSVFIAYDYSPLVEPGQRFTFTYIVKSSGAVTFTGPKVENAKVISSAVKSTDASGSTRYTYTLVAPPTAGVITVSGGAVTVGGLTSRFTKMVIEVMAMSGGRGGSGASSPAAGNPVNPSSEVMIRTDVDKKTLYVGEALCATLNLYRGPKAGGVENIEQMKFAAMGGFWSHDLTASQLPTRTNIGGRQYTKNELRQWLLYPQRAGTLTIESNTWLVMAQLLTGRRDAYGEYEMTNVRMNLASPPVSVNVLQLPKPAPVGFDGAVGQFAMETTVGASTLSANSAGTILVKLTGNGNFPLIKAPTLKFPVEFEVYETKTKDDIKNTPAGTVGTRTWEVPFIARAEGDFSIPAMDFSYFDPKTRSYKTLSTGEFRFKITRDTGAGNTSAGFVSGVTKEDLKMLGQDIRFLKTTAPDESFINAPLIKSVWFYLILLFEIAAAAGILVALRKYIKLKSDVVRTKSKGANRVALKRLRKAKTFMEADAQEKFFEEMLRALWGYMGDRLAIEVADLTKERIRAELYDRGVENDQAELFLELIAQCEMAQYAPSAAVPMRQAYEQALEVIGSMEIK